jgi:hypothetical protein
MGCEHFGQDRKRDARLVAKSRDSAPARIEKRVGEGLGRERIMPAIVVPNALTEGLVPGVPAELLDPDVLIWRNGLGGELSADPVRRLRENDAEPLLQTRYRCGATPEPASHNDQVGRNLASWT